MNKTPYSGDEKQFVTLFKQLYLEFVDIEYTYSIGGDDFMVIKTVLKKLQDRCISASDYLQWLFDVFYRDEFNKKNPPTIKSACGQRALATFLIKNEKKISSQKKKERVLSRELLIRNYAKKLFRETKNEEIRKLLEMFNDGVMSIVDLEKKLAQVTQRLNIEFDPSTCDQEEDET